MTAEGARRHATAGAIRAIRPTTEDPLETLWSAMADGLTAQRFGLHVGEWASLHRNDARAVGVAGHPRVSTLCPRWQPTSEAVAALTESGLGWVASLPLSAPNDVGVGSPLVLAPSRTALADEVSDPGLRTVVEACAQAATWWLAFFATIRDDGFHHETLADVADEVDVDTLSTAADFLLLGWATRVTAGEVIALSRADVPASSARAAEARWLLCQCVARAVHMERELGDLLTRLGELRLVELVATSFPSRRQFTAYRSGTGPGQAES